MASQATEKCNVLLSEALRKFSKHKWLKRMPSKRECRAREDAEQKRMLSKRECRAREDAEQKRMLSPFLLKGTASEPVLSAAEWMPKVPCSQHGFTAS
jgi:hypothetical protein